MHFDSLEEIDPILRCLNLFLPLPLAEDQGEDWSFKHLSQPDKNIQPLFAHRNFFHSYFRCGAIASISV